MIDRGLLIQIKELYEKKGGMILRYMDQEQYIHTWIHSSSEEAVQYLRNVVPQSWEEKLDVLMEKADSEGTAVQNGEKGELLFLEKAGKEDRIVICGAGYVGCALARLTAFAGIRTIVLEDREIFADQAKVAGADRVLCGSFKETIREIEDEEMTAYVVMTRGHSYDKNCLSEISAKTSYYVGMMGSRTRADLMREELVKEGISEEWVRKLHSPIGLKIGAQTPEEIAVSVLAEILLERSRKVKISRNGYNVFCQALHNLEPGERFILSTILERKGSAPRKEGTHFFVSESGKQFGTIGGGKLEADIIRASREMLDGKKSCCVKEFDLNNREAAEEGLVCGGHVKVLMEAGKN